MVPCQTASYNSLETEMLFKVSEQSECQMCQLSVTNTMDGSVVKVDKSSVNVFDFFF